MNLLPTGARQSLVDTMYTPHPAGLFAFGKADTQKPGKQPTGARQGR